MDNIKIYKQAYKAFKKKFHLKDIFILFHNGKYAVRPCLTAIDRDGNEQNIWIDDKFHNIDFAYVDEFRGRSGKVSQWMVAKAMFDLAQHSSIYMISSKSMTDIYCNRHNKEKFMILRKRTSLEQFLVDVDLTS